MADLIDKVAALIIIDKCLMMTWEESKGLFLFPGGKREPGEKDLQCLRRELKEELDVRIKKATYYKDYMGEYKGKAVHITCYLVELAGKPKPREKITYLAYVKTSDYDTLQDRMLPITHAVIKNLAADGLIE